MNDTSSAVCPVHPVILSGGVGSRLWPLSRETYPKQFLDVAATGRTLVQQTLDRLQGAADLAAPIVVCNQAHRFLVAEQLRDNPLGGARILLEPVGRNTAPAVAVAPDPGVNINTATARELAEALNGIGVSKAEAIVRYRTQFGPFGSIEELTEVRGIGAATVERNRSLLRLQD